METNEIPPCFERTALVAGSDMMARMAAARVTVFGVGGVGSWCVEALARSGIGNITIVDPDEVAVSNINRQLPALHSTVGRPKVEVVARRIADINPAAKVTAIQGRYTPDNGASFNLADEDFVIDAIDSLADKADLILRCTDPATAPRTAFYSSMGAARKLDPAKIRTTEFWKVDGCPLARALRRRSAARVYSHAANSSASTAPRHCPTASTTAPAPTAPSPTPPPSSASPSPASS